MSLVAIKGQTRWSLLPLSGIKPYKQRSALVRAYVDLSISIVWRNAYAPRLIIDGKSRYVEYESVGPRISSITGIANCHLFPVGSRWDRSDRSKPRWWIVVGRLIGWSRKVWTLRWNLRGGSGLLSSLNFTEDLWETMTWPRGIDKSRPTVIRQPRWHLEIWLELIFPRTGLESVWNDNYNHRFVLPLNEKKKEKK